MCKLDGMYQAMLRGDTGRYRALDNRIMEIYKITNSKRENDMIEMTSVQINAQCALEELEIVIESLEHLEEDDTFYQKDELAKALRCAHNAVKLLNDAITAEVGV